MNALAEPKKKLTSIERKALVLLVFLSLGSVYYQSTKIFLGVIFGGCLSLLNIKILARIVESVFRQQSPGKLSIILQYITKIILLLGILYLLIVYELVNIIAFVVGFSVFLMALLIENIFPSQRPV